MPKKYGDWRDLTALDVLKIAGFFALFALVALALVAFSSSEAREHATWTETPCTLDRATVRRPDRKSHDFAIAVTIRYTHGGKEYTTDSFGRPDGLPAEWGILEMTEFFEKGIKGRPDHCFVNPDDPNEAVFRRRDVGDLGGDQRPFFILLGVALIICAYAIRRGLEVGWRRPYRS